MTAQTTKARIRTKRRKRLKRRVLGFFKALLLLAALFAAGQGVWRACLSGAVVYGGYDEMYRAFCARREARRVPLDDRFDGYINILALGVDRGGDFAGLRADTILLLSLDRASGRVRAVSIPRASAVPGPGGSVRMDSLFASGGVEGMIEAARALLGVSVQDYIVADARSLAHFIDALGGVDVYVETRMDYTDPELGLSIRLPQGYQHMDGDTAQKYLRYRSGELGDIGRMQRQHRFVRALYERLLTADALGRLPRLMRILQDEIDTSLEVWDAARLAEGLRRLSRETPETLILPGRGAGDGAGLWLPDAARIEEAMRRLFPAAWETPDGAEVPDEARAT